MDVKDVLEIIKQEQMSNEIVKEITEAIEYRTPKPVQWVKFVQVFPFCPTCKRGLKEKQMYCEFCGQAIDWDTETPVLLARDL